MDAEEVVAVRVRDVAQSSVVAVAPDDCLADAAMLLATRGVGSLAVMDGDSLLGIITERDLVRAMAEGHPPRVATVAQLMTPDPIVAGADMTVDAALRLMVEADVRHLPVMDEDVLIGMVSMRRLLEQEVWRRDGEPGDLLGPG